MAAANDSQYTFQRRSHWGKSIPAKTDRMPYLRPWHRVCPDPTSTAGALLPVRRVPSQRPAATNSSWHSQAKPSTSPDDVLPKGWKMLPLPGHFFDMVGFETEDGVIYLADCLSSKETLAKYQIGVLYDVGPTWIHCSGSKPSVPTALFPPTQRPQTTLLLWPNITLTTPTKWRSTSLPCAKSPSALNICCKNCSISIT